MKTYKESHSLVARLGTAANYTILTICSLLALYPFWYEIVSSFSSSRAITAGEVSLWPVEFNTEAYKRLFEDGQLFVAMGNTVLVTLVGTAFNMTLLRTLSLRNMPN
jgi:putative aldouronate transport system permease protein